MKTCPQPHLFPPHPPHIICSLSGSLDTLIDQDHSLHYHIDHRDPHSNQKHPFHHHLSRSGSHGIIH